MQTHIMLDLETLSTEPNAMITAIGAVVMDFENCTIRETFERQIDIESYGSNSGFDMSASTVKWWLKQSDDARSKFNEPAHSYKAALFGFGNWCSMVSDGKMSDLFVWGNGAAFDNVIIKNALAREQASVTLWPYSNDRCYRTIKSVFPRLDLKVEGLTAHNALDDAKYQALYLLELHKHVGLNLP